MARYDGTNSADIIFGSSSADSLYGNGGDDNLHGRGGDDLLSGGSGDDFLFGGDGDDDLVGGSGFNDYWGNAGDDWIVMSARGTEASDDLVWDFTFNEDRVDLTAWGVSDFSQLQWVLFDDPFTGGAGLNAYWNGENHFLVLADIDPDHLIAEDFVFADPVALNVTGTAYDDMMFGSRFDDTLRGGAGDDDLLGGQGNDKLEGGLGFDFLFGGAGNDIYTVTDNDKVFELAGEGTDTVKASVSYALSVNVERLALTGSAAINGTGNGLANLITGNAGANILKGLAGADTLRGGDGADRLYGGADRDSLEGGAGADQFVFTALSDSKGATPDRITDFEIGVDKIDLKLIDANSSVSGDQAFAWVSSFSNQAGQAMLTYSASDDTSTLLLDQNGDGVADFKLLIDGHLTTGSGFIL